MPSNSRKILVNRVWQSHQLKPHLQKTFKLSRDAKFLEKLTDVVGLYLLSQKKSRPEIGRSVFSNFRMVQSVTSSPGRPRGSAPHQQSHALPFDRYRRVSLNT